MLTLALEWGWNCQLFRELHEGPPSHSSPVLCSPISKATSNPPQGLCFCPAPATFSDRHSSIPAKPRMGTQAALGHPLSQLQQQRQMLCQLHGTQPYPQPHSSYWGWRELGQHRFQQKRVEQIEISLLSVSQALQQGKKEGKGIVNTSWTFLQKSNTLVPTVFFIL